MNRHPADVCLQCEDYVVTLLPHLGGCITNFTYQDWSILRPWDGGDNVRWSSSYPLLPYSNRIADGRFTHANCAYQLRLNFNEHPHSIHGLAWQKSWQVVAQTEQSCRLMLQHIAQADTALDWPFSFTAYQNFVLDKSGLQMTLEVENIGQSDMPLGVGWHPFFTTSMDSSVQFDASDVWLNDDNHLPVEHKKVHGTRFDFSQAQPTTGLVIDNCFGGWQGQAQVLHPTLGKKVLIQADVAYVLIFSPEHTDAFVAIEPVSHRNNAVNANAPAEHGWVQLHSGQSMKKKLCITVQGYNESHRAKYE